MDSLSKLWRGWWPAPPRLHTAHYERILGTSLELQFVIDDNKTNNKNNKNKLKSRTEGTGDEAESVALEEIDRLERIFNAYSPTSEFCCWQAHQDVYLEEAAVSEELATVLEVAEIWRTRTQGAFHPGAEALTRYWKQPGEAPLTAILAALQQPLWQVRREADRAFARRIGSMPATLNAIAKGYIIDAVCRRAFQTDGIVQALVNIGGDLRHIGNSPIPVAITDPFDATENAPPVASVRIFDQGLATSGNYRRGFQVGERWYSHLIDPRTGQPVDHVVSASVIAPTAMLADILATAFSILSPAESLLLADSLPDVGLLLISDMGERHCNACWQDHLISGPTG